jgi:hypothetical protein
MPEAVNAEQDEAWRADMEKQRKASERATEKAEAAEEAEAKRSKK